MDAVVVKLPGVELSAQAKFQVLSKDGDKRARNQHIEGQHEKMGYEGSQETAKYCLAIKDHKTGKLRLVETPVLEVESFVKERRESEVADEIRQQGVKNWVQRTNLGEAFGTKKAKAAIESMARNRVDAGLLEDLESDIVDTVKDATAALPTQEQRQKAIEADRPIPPYNLETDKVADIYPIDGIVSTKELSVLKVDELLKADNPAARAELLPYSKSDYVNNRVELVISEAVNVKPRLQLLAYISFLMGVYEARRASSKELMMSKLGNPPEVLVDGILQRYTVSKAGLFGRSKAHSFAIDPPHVDKLLCYLLALCLHVDDFLVDVNPLTHELAIKPGKLAELFRALGCVVKGPTASQAESRGLSSQQAHSYKLAKLNAPLVLPEVTKRQQRR